MNQNKSDFSQATRFKMFLFLFCIISSANLFFTNAKSDHQYFNKLNHKQENVKSNFVKINCNETFLYYFNLDKAEKNDSKLILSIFEVEEEDNFSFSKKGLELFQQSTSIFLKHIVEFNITGHRLNNFGLCNLLSKYPLYISYQVFRI